MYHPEWEENTLNKAINIIQEKKKKKTKFHVNYGDTDSCLIEYKKREKKKRKKKSFFFEMYYGKKIKIAIKSITTTITTTTTILLMIMKMFKNNNLDHFDTDKFVKECKEVSNIVTNLLPEGMHLKYENTFSRMLIISKRNTLEF